MCIVLLFFCTLLYQGSSFTARDPGWTTSQYFRADRQTVISTRTGNGQKPTYTFVFSKALPGVPNLAYGIKNYRGLDSLLIEKFEIRKESLSNADFQVSVQIFQATNLILLQVGYIAIDPLFPHHLNSFDNVPLNYNNEKIVNLTRRQRGMTIQTVFINYTAQAKGNKFNTFQTPLSSNKIVMYMSSLFLQGSQDFTRISIYFTIHNTSFYSWGIAAASNVSITKLHFSQIVYNEDDVIRSNQYAIVYEDWIVQTGGDFKQFPQELKENMIMSLMDFKTTKGSCGFQYNWEFAEKQGKKGIRINPSIPSAQSSATCGFSLIRSTLFYIRTWDCQPPFSYYNISTNKCQDGCSDYLYLNEKEKDCQPCHYSCLSCRSESASDCDICETGTFRTLVNGSCLCDEGYFDNGYNQHCQKCSDPINYCSKCQFNIDPSQSQQLYKDLFASRYWKSSILSDRSYDFKCQKCQMPYAINETSGFCEPCRLRNCQVCENVKKCSVCKPSTSTVVSSIDNLCYLCSKDNCNECSSDNICNFCQSGYYLQNNTCFKEIICTLDDCSKCSSDNYCSTCEQGFLLENATCVKPIICTLQQCTECSKDNFCSLCQQGLFLSNGLCLQKKQQQLKLFDQQNTFALSLIVFVIGCLRVAGVEMLFVFQTFQLAVKTLELEHNTEQMAQGVDQKLVQEPQILLDISSQIHGYNDYSSFPIKSDYFSSQHLFASFNVMFIVMITMLSIGLICKCIGALIVRCSKKKRRNEVTNSYYKRGRSRNQNQESEGQGKREESADGFVNYPKSSSRQKKHNHENSPPKGSIRSKDSFQQFQTRLESPSRVNPNKSSFFRKKTKQKNIAFQESETSENEAGPKHHSSTGSRSTRFGNSALELFYFLIAKQLLFSVLINCMCSIIYWVSQSIFKSKLAQGPETVFDLPSALAFFGYSLLLVALMIILCFFFDQNQGRRLSQKQEQFSTCLTHHEEGGFGQTILKFTSCSNFDNEKERKKASNKNSTQISQQSMIEQKLPKKPSNKLKYQTVYRHRLFWSIAAGQRLIYSVLLGACPGALTFKTALFLIVGIKLAIIVVLVAYWFKTTRKDDDGDDDDDDDSEDIKKNQRRKRPRQKNKKHERKDTEKSYQKNQQYPQTRNQYLTPPLFCHKIQQIRSIVIQVLHLILLIFLLFSVQIKQLFSSNSSSTDENSNYAIEYIFISILASVTAISLGFYVREAMNCFQTDYCQSISFRVSQNREYQRQRSITVTDFNDQMSEDEIKEYKKKRMKSIKNIMNSDYHMQRSKKKSLSLKEKERFHHRKYTTNEYD